MINQLMVRPCMYENLINLTILNGTRRTRSAVVKWTIPYSILPITSNQEKDKLGNTIVNVETMTRPIDIWIASPGPSQAQNAPPQATAKIQCCVLSCAPSESGGGANCAAVVLGCTHVKKVIMRCRDTPILIDVISPMPMNEGHSFLLSY